MFGYVQPLKPELKIKEFACYKSYYCGVCKALGDEYGQLSRFTVSYDAAFLALLNFSLMEDEERVCFEKCVVNPFKPKPVVRENAAISYAAAVNLLMAYFKLEDGWRDEKSIPLLLASRIFSPYIRRVRSAYPAVYETVREQLDRQAQVEAEKVSSVDAAAEPFARMLSIVLPFPQLEKHKRRVLEWMGYNLGKWIYVMDAFSDIESDIRSGNYNVLVARYGKDTHALLSGDDIFVRQLGKSLFAWQTRGDRLNKKGERESLALRIRENSRKEVEFILNTCLAEIGKAYELLDIRRNGGLLENIIFLGLPYKMQMILNGGREGDGPVQGFGREARRNSGGDKGGLQEDGQKISS
ncbi:hypothetical protein JOD02_000026 [Caldicoprobacter guelmensis]|uniref:DUF5685 family protein n=1 Tax=Caldicoprobacter guelmensis TaxID=1170224 RepID=UPI00195D6F1D|nr:DUF5685 family protein [Caldicoprobacter guelmensis]MBM7581203.1 hypothetical protein [Caldicoprobacter guelmensis]